MIQSYVANVPYPGSQVPGTPVKYNWEVFHFKPGRNFAQALLFVLPYWSTSHDRFPDP
jgi:hypothetical protein